MIHVRSHKRRVASGREVSVIAHQREGGAGGDIVRPAPEWAQPEYVGDLTPVADERGTSPEFRAMFLGDEATEEDIWADEVEVGDVTADCPACGSRQPVNLGGTLAGHREPGEMDYCPGSGTEIK